VQALWLYLECIMSRDKEAPVGLPEVNTATDLPGAIAGLLNAVAAGVLTPSEAKTLSALIRDAGRVLELHDTEECLIALEEAQR